MYLDDAFVNVHCWIHRGGENKSNHVRAHALLNTIFDGVMRKLSYFPICMFFAN